MQSDGNSFCGDIVLDSFNKASKDEDNIVDLIYMKLICSNLYYEDFNFLLHFTTKQTNIRIALKPNFMSSLF